MNQINPKKLLHTKWTALPKNKELLELRKLEKHFTVVKVKYDDDQSVLECRIEAVMTRRCFQIDWRSLKNTDLWQQGWK